MKPAGLTLALVVGALLLFNIPAWSDSKGKKDKGEDAHVTDLMKEAKITIEQAIKTAAEKAPGTIVEAELEKKHGKTVWEVEVVGADGAVTEVHIDAASGEVIDTEMKPDEHKKEGKKGKK
ncbi:MAG TPA: PepSY domain-containing protein [Nitrospiraceae bacterium]|nr:PepSY domain-containing protein [Nitrospiraceae bacterium]